MDREALVVCAIAHQSTLFLRLKNDRENVLITLSVQFVIRRLFVVNRMCGLQSEFIANIY